MDTIKIPEAGVEESKWLVVGSAQFVALRDENAALRSLVTDILESEADDMGYTVKGGELIARAHALLKP